MPERERKQRPAPKERVDEEVEDLAPSKQGEELKEELDDLLDEHGIARGDVGLLWMDVQGHERHVLDGAPKLLASGVSLVVELWPYGLRRAGVEPEAFADYLGTRFRSYYDLGQPAPIARPTAELPASLGQLVSYKSFTDLLLVP